ncbi:hypothetical protein B0T19DRAFT_208113 [Cercophora scortea]|uniref:tRNA-splicing endonuclease subunit Sen34 n=1 Tax=Cercophora scortea TaxID=314031 RepID=A0AAE0M8N4_9PEZI|nr:hypothetical protein B0T19DRAFT_208113 [Cercophora scortea]
MASSVTDRQVRISRIAGRYLVFDIDDVVHIRRHHSICAVFTGTMPQNPTQNVFLGLPIELYAQEAKILVDKKAGYIVDDAADHLTQLKTMDESSRKEYIQSLKVQRKNAQLVFEEAKALSQARHQDKRKATSGSKKARETNNPAPPATVEQEDTLFDTQPVKPAPAAAAVAAVKDTMPALTPTTSSTLIVPQTSSTPVEVPSSFPLQAYLNSRGYFITPGLRFGGDFSVYPGDPLRYHAHYLATSYEWEKKIPLLDLLTSGRLGTAVKKSFLLGGQQPQDQVAESEKVAAGGDDVRVFCIEWAGM